MWSDTSEAIWADEMGVIEEGGSHAQLFIRGGHIGSSFKSMTASLVPMDVARAAYEAQSIDFESTDESWTLSARIDRARVPAGNYQVVARWTHEDGTSKHVPVDAAGPSGMLVLQ